MEQPGGEGGEECAEGSGEAEQSKSGGMQERREADRKMHSTLEGYLVELTSFKGRANSSCQASIR